MLTLYQFGNSVCAQKVRITLAEKQLPWEGRNIDLFRGEQYSPEYLKLNPKGVVPTLVHDGAPIIESTLICEYLDDAFPTPRLVPAEPLARARMRVWSKLVDEGLHDGVTELSFSAMFRERMQAMPEEKRAERFRNVGDPKRRDRFMSTYQHGVDSPYVLHAIAAYEKAFTRAEETLAAGGPWLLGAEYSLADINLLPYLARLEYLGLLDIWLADRPAVRAWWARAKSRPAYIAGIAAPTTAEEAAEMHSAGIRIRPRVDAIRSTYLAEK